MASANGKTARTSLMRRPWFIATCGVLAAVLLAVVLAPLYLGGYVRGVVEREVGANVNGVVTVGAVRLGWFSPQRVEALAIDGGKDTGSLAFDAEVRQGLLALATGDEVTVSLSGSAQTPVDAEGRVGLARLARGGDAAQAGKQGGAEATAAAPGGTPLGGRRIRIELDRVDLAATREGAPLFSIDALTGWVGLEGTDANELKVDGDLKAGTTIAGARADGAAAARKGDVSASFDTRLPRRADGSLDARAASGSAKIDATNLPVPGPEGQGIVADSLNASVAVTPQGANLTARSTLRAGGAAPATIDAIVATGALFDARGEFALDPASVKADVKATALPMAALQPYAPELRDGVRLDFVADVGLTADLRLVKDTGKRANITIDAQRVKLSFDAAVAPDGSSIEDGTLEASVSVRPELLRALEVDAAGPLVARADGSRVTWRKAERALDGVGGAFSVELARPLAVRGAFAAGGEKVDVRADSLRATVDKQVGGAKARIGAAVAGVYGADSAMRAAIAGELDLGSRALTAGTIDATVALDPGIVERATNKTIATARGGNSAKLVVPSFAYRPAEGRGALQSLEARGRLEVAGELAVASGSSRAKLRDLGLDFTLPTGKAPGSVDLAVRVDGAETRIVQRVAAIPADAGDLGAYGLEGTIDIRGLDPSVVAQTVPAAKDSLGILGKGPMTLSVRNRTDAGALVADFTLAAAALNASGGARYARDSFAATNVVCDATLTPELLAAVKVPDSVSVAQGAKASLRVPTIAVTKGADGWSPSGDIAARLAVDRLRLERAPGLKAALDVPKLEADATYSMKDERATAKGFATIGAGGSAGRLGYDLTYASPGQKPAPSKFFRGVEGTLSLTGFDLARVEGPLGLEPGGYSGMLGGAGNCTVELRERGAAQAKVALDFPKTRGAITVDVLDDVAGGGARRIARAAGSVDAQIAAEAFAALAGLGKDPKRRVTTPVDAKLAIKSADVPLDADMKPVLADAALDVTGSLSPVAIEVTDAQGQKSTVSTGALALLVKTARLSDDLLVKVSGADKPAAGAAAGALDLDARVRGAVARAKDAKATPTIDATLKATKFPAATIDALAGARGVVGRYVGDAIDAEVVARNLSMAGGAQGSLSAKLSSEYATVEAPALSVGEGFLRSGPEKPMRATFSLSPEVREQLLTPINPIFSDVNSKERARFTLTNLAWPLDGDRSKFDAAFMLETGEITLTNSGPLAFLLSMLDAQRTGGFEAQIDPLRATVSKGRLAYRDFVLHMGRTQQGTWRNSLVFSGDIDLVATPMYANAIRTGVPLSDAANWSSDARRIFDSIGAVSPELLKSLSVGVKLSGALFDANGRPAKLKQELALPEIGDVLKRDPGAVVEGIGGIIDAIRKKKK